MLTTRRKTLTQDGLGRLAREQFVRFFRWWGGELRGLLPESVWSWLTGRRSLDVVINGDGSMVIDDKPVDPDRMQTLGAENSFRNRLVQLIIPVDQAIVRDIELPIEARKNLDEILGLEIDKYTPMRSDQALFTYALRQSTRPTHLALTLIVVPIRIASRAVARLAALGLKPARITVAGRPRYPLRLDRVGLKSLGLIPWREVALAVFVFAVLYGGAYASAAFEQQRWEGLTGEIAQTQRTAREAAALRAELEQLDARRRALQQRDVGPTMLSIMAELTRVLPDHAWVQEVSLSRRTITIIGNSQAAQELIERLENSPLLERVRFRAAVIPSPMRGYERFDIVAEIEGTI